MCYECECENEFQCSIKGHGNMWFCCDRCESFNFMHTCLKSKLFEADTSQVSILPKAFCIKTRQPAELEELDFYQE